MSDLIERRAAIDKFEPWLKVKEYSEGELNMLKAVLYELKFFPSEQHEPKWIPCSERLPEDYTDVLVWFEYFRYGSYNRTYQTYGIGTYSGQYGYDSWMINHETGWKNLRVIAWMPLPEPYKEDNNG